MVHERVEALHKLRNRVGHHEPIFLGLTVLNKPQIALTDLHRYIVEMLGWISPALPTALAFVDRFPDVYTNERARIQRRLADHFDGP